MYFPDLHSLSSFCTAQLSSKKHFSLENSERRKSILYKKWSVPVMTFIVYWLMRYWILHMCHNRRIIHHIYSSICNCAVFRCVFAYPHPYKDMWKTWLTMDVLNQQVHYLQCSETTLSWNLVDQHYLFNLEDLQCRWSSILPVTYSLKSRPFL